MVRFNHVFYVFFFRNLEKDGTTEKVSLRGGRGEGEEVGGKEGGRGGGELRCYKT